MSYAGACFDCRLSVPYQFNRNVSSPELKSWTRLANRGQTQCGALERAHHPRLGSISVSVSVLKPKITESWRYTFADEFSFRRRNRVVAQANWWKNLGSEGWAVYKDGEEVKATEEAEEGPSQNGSASDELPSVTPQEATSASAVESEEVLSTAAADNAAEGPTETAQETPGEEVEEVSPPAQNEEPQAAETVEAADETQEETPLVAEVLAESVDETTVDELESSDVVPPAAVPAEASPADEVDVPSVVAAESGESSPEDEFVEPSNESPVVSEVLEESVDVSTEVVTEETDVDSPAIVPGETSRADGVGVPLVEAASEDVPLVDDIAVTSIVDSPEEVPSVPPSVVDSTEQAAVEEEFAAAPAVAAQDSVEPPESAATAVEEPTITLRYSTSWNPAFLHHSADDGRWTELPGTAMSSADSGEGDDPAQVISIAARAIEFVITDGAGNWDHSSTGGNYQIDRPGSYQLAFGEIEELQ